LFAWSRLRLASRIMLVLVFPLGSLFIVSKISPIMLALSRYLNPERNIFPKNKQEIELMCILTVSCLSMTRQIILSISDHYDGMCVRFLYGEFFHH